MNTKNPKNQKKTQKRRENQKFIIVYIYTEKKKEAERRKKGIPQKEAQGTQPQNAPAQRKSQKKVKEGEA